MTIEEIEAAWKEYRTTGGGGLIPFDTELHSRKNAHLPQANREELGIDAMFHAFLDFLRSRT